MKYIKGKNPERLRGRQLTQNSTFFFRCYPGISCFNRCCRNLNLFLYPYDIVRLKKCLEISSGQFLDRYVDVVLREGSYFPDVLLRMEDNQEKTCPFLTPKGCRVYSDRPDACRTFPLEQGMIFDDESGQGQLVHFFRPPEFCMGQYEKAQWTPKSWEKDQEAESYHKMTAQWARLKGLFHNNPWGKEGPEGPKAKMSFMATYNIDCFREFVFDSSFLKRYKVKSSLIKKFKNNDTELLKFGFKWVQFFLWGMNSKDIRFRASAKIK